MVDDDTPLYDPADPALWALLDDLHLHTLHYGITTTACGAEVPAQQRTDITALVNCQQCLRLVPPRTWALGCRLWAEKRGVVIQSRSGWVVQTWPAHPCHEWGEGGVLNVEIRRLRKPASLCFNGSKTSALNHHLHF